MAFKSGKGKAPEYTARALFTAVMRNRFEDDWSNAAASFRIRARNLDESGRRYYNTMIDEAANDQSIPTRFREELRRQVISEVFDPERGYHVAPRKKERRDAEQGDE